jgi:ribonuclease HI
MTRVSPVKVFFDGGCRPNPGRIEIAVVARGQTWIFDDLGEGSSSDAEWLALCRALEIAQSLAQPIFDLVGDSRSVIEQANDAVPTRNYAARNHRDRYKAAAAALPPRRLRWTPRAQNLAGIALSRRYSLPRQKDGSGQ